MNCAYKYIYLFIFVSSIDIVDLSDEEDDKPKQAKPNNGIRMVPTANLVGVNRGTTVLQTPVAILQSKKPTLQVTHVSPPVIKHPAPLPDPPKFQIAGQNMKSAPPKPTLKISRLTEGKPVINSLFCVSNSKNI